MCFRCRIYAICLLTALLLCPPYVHTNIRKQHFWGWSFYVQKRLRLLASKNLKQLAVELPMFQDKALSINKCPALGPVEFSNTVSH